MGCNAFPYNRGECAYAYNNGKAVEMDMLGTGSAALFCIRSGNKIDGPYADGDGIFGAAFIATQGAYASAHM